MISVSAASAVPQQQSPRQNPTTCDTPPLSQDQHAQHLQQQIIKNNMFHQVIVHPTELVPVLPLQQKRSDQPEKNEGVVGMKEIFSIFFF